MSRSLHPILIPLLALTLSLLPSVGAVAQPGHPAPSPSAAELIAEVNALRAANNLPSYQINPVLMRTAQAHAEYIASTGVPTQFSAEGKRPFQRALDAGYSVGGDLSLGGSFAELIRSGADLTPAGAVNAWKGDAVQSQNLLSVEFQDAGAGMAAAGGIVYYVLDVGAEGNPVTPTSTAAAPGVFIVSTAGARGTEAVIVMVSTPLPNGEVFHVVQKGDALWSIALAYGTTIDELKRINRLPSDAIFEGQTLLVRTPEPETETPLPPEASATFGIPTSTATRPSPPTPTSTPTPVPAPPASLQSGALIALLIVVTALLAAGIGARLGGRKARGGAD
jgi:uncharacterized protein YkwD/LysM repeat protein